MGYLASVIKWLWEGVKEAFSIYKPVQEPVPNQPTIMPNQPQTTPTEAPSAPQIPSVDTLLPWVFGKSLTHNNWHNVRVLCDLEDLSTEMKEELCATVWGESEFNTAARLDNKDKTGKVWSTDFGICQWNSYWHGKEISTTDAVNDPEKAVRLMCQYFKRGQADQWVAHSSGRYKQFMYRKL